MLIYHFPSLPVTKHESMKLFSNDTGEGWTQNSPSPRSLCQSSCDQVNVIDRSIDLTHGSPVTDSNLPRSGPEGRESGQLAGLSHGVVGGDTVVSSSLDVPSHNVVSYLSFQ